MNFREITEAIQHLLKTSNCANCKKSHTEEDIQVVATTRLEGLFEMKCDHCKSSTIVTVMLTPEIEVKKTNPSSERKPQGIKGNISNNDILDIKNFLNNFDGDFKKIFSKEN